MEYNKFSVKDLKTILDKKGVKGCSKYRKDELINILSKLENIEDEVEKENEVNIPEPPELKIDNKENNIENEQKNENNEEAKIEEESNTQELEIEEKDQELEIEEENNTQELEIEVENTEEVKPLVEERIKDPVKLFENFKPSLAISGDKKSEILKGMIEFKTAQKMMERQEIQREIDKVANQLKIMREEYLSIIDLIKRDLKEVRESFLMANLIILHNFSFLPLDKLPIFKSQALKK